MSRRKLLKFLIAGAGVAIALVLLFGPEWVQPEHPELGVPYTQLPDDHPDKLAKGAPQRSLAIFVLCLSLWVSHVIPLPATSLLAVALVPLLNVLPEQQSFGYFGNSAVFFILGVFILSAAMIDSGLSKRLTLRFIQRFDRTPARLVRGVFICAAFFSLWMPEHAVAAMMYPLVFEVSEALKLKKPGSRYARSLFLALAWGAVVGGVGTYLGGARAVLAVELYKEFHPDAVVPSFLEYARMTVPIVIILSVVGYYIITVGSRHEVESISQATRMIDARVRDLGPMAGREKRLSALMIVTIVAWIFLGHTVGLGTISVVASIMVFVLRISDWKRVQDYVNWGVLLMYGGAVALGASVADTKAMDWLAGNVVPFMAEHRFLLVAITAIVTLALTESMSNAAVVSLMLPMVFGICHEQGAQGGMDPLGMMYLVAISSGLAFCLPMSSPPNAIAFSSGYYGIGDAVVRGLIMTIVALVVFLLTVWLYWPWMGVNLWAG